MTRISRRRFLSISGTALGLALLPHSAIASPHKITWQGRALGGEASLTLYHPNSAYGEDVIKDCVNEIRRLEKIFSLFQRESNLVRLNKQGHLDHPPTELVDLLKQASQISNLSRGAFDVSVQPLWILYARHFAKKGADPHGPSKTDISKATSLVGWENISVENHQIRLLKKGMALSLNGIAQGYITDHISDFLKTKGFTNMLVNLGEFKGSGQHPDGLPWRIQLAGFDIVKTVTLTNQAIATSGGYGTTFDPSGNHHHLFNPHTGTAAQAFKQISVLASTATLADALSTTLAVSGDLKLLEFFPKAKAHIL